MRDAEIRLSIISSLSVDLFVSLALSFVVMANKKWYGRHSDDVPFSCWAIKIFVSLLFYVCRVTRIARRY